MAFKIAARTILELGAELISSDGVALYELIKNAYDAESKRASIHIVTVFKYSHLRNVTQRLEAAEHPGRVGGTRVSAQLVEFHNEVEGLLDKTAPEDARQKFLALLGRPTGLREFAGRLRRAFDQVNCVEVIDTGVGMTLANLNDVFLTIGTRSRLEPASPGKRFVGGKGIGRLSAMRLGDKLEVVTAREGEERWNILNIDWSIFSHESSLGLDEIPVAAGIGSAKEKGEHGTTVRILGLKADWDQTRVSRMAELYFDRLFDPFGERPRYPLVIRVNDVRVKIPLFEREVYAGAQAKAKVQYAVDGASGPRMTIEMEYMRYGRTKTDLIDQADLLGLSSREDLSITAFGTLGPFSASFHWFNRQRIKAIDGWGDRNRAKAVVNSWANGLLMYRDGFRVAPYGDPNDDWLGIDAIALSSGGYKLNRKQLLGAVYISAAGNPHLIDQTNREGLRSNEEKQLLVLLMQTAITDRLKKFLDAVEKEARPPRIDAAETGQFLQSVTSKLQRTLEDLNASVPKERREEVKFLQTTYGELESRLETARSSLAAAERDYKDLVSLAGIGLQVEIVAHELGRISRRTLEIIGALDRKGLSRELSATLDTVASQMLVIRKRLDMLDPLGPSSRNRRREIDLRETASQILDSHADRFAREGIRAELQLDADDAGEALAKVVPGMIVQVLENLIDNSVFWLRQKRRADPAYSPFIRIVVDSANSQIRVTDNGPGVARDRAQAIFDPFVTSKPPGEGKGLGLYISREIAHQHSGDLYLLDEPDRHGRLHTFVLETGAA